MEMLGAASKGTASAEQSMTEGREGCTPVVRCPVLQPAYPRGCHVKPRRNEPKDWPKLDFHRTHTGMDLGYLTSRRTQVPSMLVFTTKTHAPLPAVTPHTFLIFPHLHQTLGMQLKMYPAQRAQMHGCTHTLGIIHGEPAR